MKIVNITSHVFSNIQQYLSKAKEITIVTASLSRQMMDEFEHIIPNDCKKTLIVGMFAKDSRTQEAMVCAGLNHWKLIKRECLHAKLIVIRRRDNKWIVVLGSSNLSLMANYYNLELNIILSGWTLDKRIRRFLNYIKKKMR